MQNYNILTWGDNGEDWLLVNDLLAKTPLKDIEREPLGKMALQKAEDFRERLERLFPDKFFLVVESSRLRQP